MDLLTVRDALAETVREFTGLPVYEVPTGQLSAPGVILGAPSGRYDADLDGGMSVEWALLVIVTRSHPDSLSNLAAICGTEDDRSIQRALSENAPDPDVASYWRVRSFDPWTELEVGSAAFWSSELTVEVVG